MLFLYIDIDLSTTMTVTSKRTSSRVLKKRTLKKRTLNKCPRKEWTPEQDSELKLLRINNPEYTWSKISKEMGRKFHILRSADAVRHRYGALAVKNKLVVLLRFRKTASQVKNAQVVKMLPLSPFSEVCARIDQRQLRRDHSLTGNCKGLKSGDTTWMDKFF